MERKAPVTRARIRRASLLIQELFLAALIVLPARARGGEAFLIVERPGSLVLYDRYQQSMSPRDRAALPPFLPMHILSPRTLLGDGVTRCMNVEVQGVPFYLLLEPGDRLAGEGDAGHVARYSGVLQLDDTVIVLAGGRIAFGPPDGGRSQMLDAGERLFRSFSDGIRTYAQRLSATGGFGWITLEERERNRTWRDVRRRGIAAPVITERLRDSVRSRIAGVNRVLAVLYSYFNMSMHVHREPPRWTVRAAGDSVVCTFGDPAGWSESTRWLAKDLESLVLGSGLAVTSTPGRIVIRPG